MEEDKIAIINVATEVKIINIPYATGWTAEDLCIKVRISDFLLIKSVSNESFIAIRITQMFVAADMSAIRHRTRSSASLRPEKPFVEELVSY